MLNSQALAQDFIHEMLLIKLYLSKLYSSNFTPQALLNFTHEWVSASCKNAMPNRRSNASRQKMEVYYSFVIYLTNRAMVHIHADGQSK